MKRLALSFAALIAASMSLALPASGDEGMWLLNKPPMEMLKQRYGFSPSPAWFEHLQKAAVRFGFGGSASFVSPEGLVITNHHVVRGQLSKLSTPEHDYLKNGFYAPTRDQELKCPDAVVNCLQQIVDVTDRVRKAAAGAANPAAAEDARRAEIAAIEREAQQEGLYGEVVRLYGGGLYNLYKYKRFTDIRLVFAPESAIADFGGDVQNFEFPRYDYDIGIVRVYENGKPYHPDNYLKITTDGITDGEPVFVVGHPGRTQRLFTVDHLRYLRDVSYPKTLHYARTREVELQILCSESAEQQAIAVGTLVGYQNLRKGLGGKLRALEDPRVFEKKIAEERDFRDKVNARPAVKAEVGDAWDQVAIAEHRAAGMIDQYRALEGGRPTFGGSSLFRIARMIVRLVEEQDKPDAERLQGYHEAQMPNIELRLYSEAPIHDFMEIDDVESFLGWTAEELGGENPITEELLGGKSPRDRAIELVSGCTLGDVSARRALVEGGKEAVLASDDPMIRLALEIDPEARAIRKKWEDEVDAVESDAYARLASARFEIYGENVYPDATFSLRLSTGTVKGFDMEGKWIEPFTDFGEMYRRAAEFAGNPQFRVPKSWEKAKGRLDLGTPFNFASTNDIIGGNSGSPVVNRDGAFVGIIFDGNRYSFVWDAIYEGERGRAVSVDARAIIEGLEKVYHADGLVKELLGK